MMVFVSVPQLYVPQAWDMKTILHHSRLQTCLFVPCCQPGSTSSSCLHLDTCRNLWAHLIGVPGHLSFLLLPFLNLLGTFLASKPGKAPYLDCSLLLCSLHILVHQRSHWRWAPPPMASVKLSQAMAHCTHLSDPIFCYAQQLEMITHHRCSSYSVSRQMIHKSVGESWKLLNCLFWENGPGVQWGTVGTLESVRSWFKYSLYTVFIKRP